MLPTGGVCYAQVGWRRIAGAVEMTIARLVTAERRVEKRE